VKRLKYYHACEREQIYIKFHGRCREICGDLRIEEDNVIASETLSFNSKFCPDKKGFIFAVHFNAFNT
jgi:hypothetical protein